MAARNRGGIHGAVPWVALIVVTIFAFNQLAQRSRARAQATKAQNDLRALQGLQAGAMLKIPLPVVADAEEAVVADVVTDRERQLDTALQAALELTRADTKRIALLDGERADERARAERLAAVQDSEAARARALQARCTGLTAETAAAARKVQALEQGAQAREAVAAEALRATQKRLADAHKQSEATYARVSQQLAVSVGALAKAEDVLAGTLEGMQMSREREQEAARGQQAAEASLAALRQRLLRAVTVQLASEDPTALVTGARMVGLLRMSGSVGALLALTDHDEPTVVVAAARALAAAGDLGGAALEAGDAALALLGDDAISIRMAGLELLRAVTGKEIVFDVGGSTEVRAAAWKKLSKQLGS